MSRRARLLIFAAGACVFGILVAKAGSEGLLDHLRATAWVLGPIVAVWALVYVCNTVAWLQLVGATAPRQDRASAAHIPFWRAYVISVASFALNYVTPFVALGGEPFRIVSAAQYVGTPRAAGSVISFRVVHTIGHFIFCLIAVPIALVLLPPTPLTLIVIALATVGLLVAIVLMAALFRSGFAVRLLDMSHRIPLVRRVARRLEQVRDTLEHVDSHMSSLRSVESRRLAIAIAVEVLGRAITALEILFIARAVGLKVDYGTAYLIYAFSQLAIMLTIIIPFELGSREASLLLIFSLLGLPPELGVYTAVVTRLRELVWIGVGLGFVWASGPRRQRPGASTVIVGPDC
jgi:uncharacterized protein (TIRG00374 family)